MCWVKECIYKREHEKAMAMTIDRKRARIIHYVWVTCVRLREEEAKSNNPDDHDQKWG